MDVSEQQPTESKDESAETEDSPKNLVTDKDEPQGVTAPAPEPTDPQSFEKPKTRLDLRNPASSIWIWLGILATITGLISFFVFDLPSSKSW